jgi:hypothetical protein
MLRLLCLHLLLLLELLLLRRMDELWWGDWLLKGLIEEELLLIPALPELMRMLGLEAGDRMGLGLLPGLGLRRLLDLLLIVWDLLVLLNLTRRR